MVGDAARLLAGWPNGSEGSIPSRSAVRWEVRLGDRVSLGSEGLPTPAGSVTPSGYESEREHLLHTMHDASKFADGAAKAILEGVLHHYEYGGRTPSHQAASDEERAK